MKGITKIWKKIVDFFRRSVVMEDIIVGFQKLHENAVLPTCANPGDAGLDLVVTSLIENDEYSFYEYGTGLAVEIPKGYVGLIYPRSSISKKNIYLTNGVGVIDSGYRGEIKFRFKPDISPSSKVDRYKVGDKIGQLMIVPYPTVIPTWKKTLTNTERGEGGFGSSDKTNE